MARENNALSVSTSLTTEPTFTTVFRGYHKREVDQYAHLVESHLAASVAERQEMHARIRGLTDELQRVHTEVVELRRRPVLDDKVTFRHLGPRVEQILIEAEEQADAIRRAAADALDADRAELRAEINGVRVSKESVRRELEDELAQHRADADREIARMRADVAVELEESKAYAVRARAEAESTLNGARDEAKRLADAAGFAAERLRSDAMAQAAAVRGKAEQDAAGLAMSAEQYAQQTRQAADRHAHETRQAAEQRSRQVTEAAEMGATELREQAEQHAAWVRTAAESHASRLHANLDLKFIPDRPGATAAPTSPAAPAVVAQGA